MTGLPPDGTDFGDFVSNEDEQLDLEELVEPWHKYDIKETPNIFYPICLGEVLNERYLVEHKLGFGGGSTVWMAHDLHDKRDVALKVMSLGDWGENEYHMQDEILKNVEDTSRLVTYLGTFLLPGDKHRVLVFPVMDPCIYPIELEKIPMASRMSAARQLLEALGGLHNAGIVHRGKSAKYEALGRPLKQIIPFVELWRKGELVSPVNVPENLRTEEFFLGDFGLAKKLSDSAAQRGYPPSQYCSPERLHGKDPSFACDMWSYMVVFSVIYLGFVPFPTWLKGGVISAFVRCLGPLPEEWKGLSMDGLDSWYDQSTTPDPNHDLASTIAYFHPDGDPIERKHVASIMCKVFQYCPEKRPTATQLLQDPSFRAIMEKYGC
ncbi:kinase domain-containing protein [Penicillium cf. griseofulvum]|nr:kinase domain-containing protein [Penicillium cf. griseofulvum]